MDSTLEITKTEYMKLLAQEVYLEALQSAGVDNWDDGGLTMEIFEENSPELVEYL